MRHNPSEFDQIVESTHPRAETLAELGRRIGDGFEAPAFLSAERSELARLRAENETLKRRMLAHGISLEPTIEEVIAENYAAGMREYVEQSDDFVKGNGEDNRTHELRPANAQYECCCGETYTPKFPADRFCQRCNNAIAAMNNGCRLIMTITTDDIFR